MSFYKLSEFKPNIFYKFLKISIYLNSLSRIVAITPKQLHLVWPTNTSVKIVSLVYTPAGCVMVNVIVPVVMMNRDKNVKIPPVVLINFNVPTELALQDILYVMVNLIVPIKVMKLIVVCNRDKDE